MRLRNAVHRSSLGPVGQADELLTVVKVLGGIRDALDDHARGCCEWVSGIALHPNDFQRLRMAEVWGLSVLAWDHVVSGRLRILCDGHGVLTPEYENVEDVLEHWEHGLRRPA